ncbi:MAG: hypothetical protein NUV53_04280 [Patescibacteria group bacterium]|nr:hypothetical protein [Patescibacteria group bacterium]
MKVFKLDSSGAQFAIPEVMARERRYAFFHGGSLECGKYCLRLSKTDFPITQKNGWYKEEFALLPSKPPQWDEVGNELRVMKRSKLPPTGECIVLLNTTSVQHSRGGMLHSWNAGVKVLGKGVDVKPMHEGNKAARKSVEIEYPILACSHGAEFAWECEGRDYHAQWDGAIWQVTEEIPMLPMHGESHLATRGFLRF